MHRRQPLRVAQCALASACLALAATVGLRAQTYTWRNVQIHGGGFTPGIIFHPTTPNLMYVRTDVGGAYRWDNTNSVWVPLNDNLNFSNNELAGVLSLAVDPNNSNLLYLASGMYTASWARNAAIQRSSDRGATWSRTELPFKLGGNEDGRNTGERLQVDPNLGSILFLGTTLNGLWKSTDSGVTWSEVTAFSPTSTTLVAFDKGSGSPGSATPVIYVGVNTTSGPSLFESNNGGASWSAVAGGPSSLLPTRAEFDANRMLYLSYGNALGPNGVTSGAVRKLSSSGTWTNITPLAPGSLGQYDQFGYGAVTASRLSPGTLYASTLDRWNYGDELFRSTDGGATWTATSSFNTYSSPDAVWVFWHRPASSFRPTWVGDIEIDPFNDNHVIFGTGAGFGPRRRRSVRPTPGCSRTTASRNAFLWN